VNCIHDTEVLPSLGPPTQTPSPAPLYPPQGRRVLEQAPFYRHVAFFFPSLTDFPPSQTQTDFEALLVFFRIFRGRSKHSPLFVLSPPLSPTASSCHLAIFPALPTFFPFSYQGPGLSTQGSATPPPGFFARAFSPFARALEPRASGLGSSPWILVFLLWLMRSEPPIFAPPRCTSSRCFCFFFF